ncbi:unnamed protein product [Leptosia nina]|uniref:Gustatory receptor n=1 Tax=Leptosia nina TaxID=320188 RepID=A0AAV1IZD8_9NEOP
MEIKGGASRDITVAVFYCLRIVGMAPVSIKHLQDGYRFAFKRIYSVYGIILISSLNIGHICIAGYDVINGLKKEPTILGNNTVLVTLLWLFDVVTSVMITQIVILRGMKQTQNIIECCKKFDEIKGKVQIPRYTSIGYKVFLVLFFLSQIGLDALYTVGLTDTYQGEDYTLQTLLYCLTFSAVTKYVIVCLLQIQMFASYLEVALHVKYVREELQELNDTLTLDDSDSSFYVHSVNNRLKHIGETFESTKNIFSEMNESSPGVHALILLNLSFRLVINLHGISGFLINPETNFDPSLQDEIPMWIFVCDATHIIVGIMLMTQPYANMECELRIVKLLLGSIMTMKNYVYNVFPYVDMFYRDLISFDFTYSPLGVVTMQRSIVVQVIGVGITIIAAIVQFQKKK